MKTDTFSDGSRILWEAVIDFGLQKEESLALVPPDRKIANDSYHAIL